MVKRPSVRAAALANTSAAPSASRVASASGIGEPRQTESAYDGLPGPAKMKLAVRRRDSAHRLGARAALGGIGGERAGIARGVDRELHPLGEVLDRLLRDLRAVLLEPVRRVEQHGARRHVAQPGHDVAMRGDHRRRRLAGAHEREDAWSLHAAASHAQAKKPSRTALSRMSATRSGNSRCRSWWPGENQTDCTLAALASAAVSARRLASVRLASPLSASEQERRRLQRRPAHGRPVLPQRAHDGQMAIALQPRLDGAVGPRAEAVQVRADGALAEVRQLRLHPGLELGQREVVQARRRHRGQAVLPRGKPVGQLDDAAVDARDAADDLRLAPAELQHDVAAPRLAGQHRPLEAERADQREQVGHGGLEVVSGRRRIRAPVTALVDGEHAVAERVEPLGHAVPETDVGRQPVDEHEGRGARVAEPLLDVQRDSGRHFDAPLVRYCRRCAVG